VLRYDRPAELRQGIEDNLRSLAVDHLTVVNLRLMDGAPPGEYFDDQLAAMVAAREDGLIGGIGLSNITPGHLRRALAITDIACVQNLLNLADRRSMPVLEECHARGIAFVPFFPLGSGFARGGNPVQVGSAVAATAARLRCTPAQVALAWLLDLRPEVLLIPGTSSLSHLEDRLALQLCLSASDLGDGPRAGSVCLNFSLDCGSISRTDHEERARWPTCPPRRAQVARRAGQSPG
jgi:pyridoxine 4-dehydrogenase